MRHGDAHRKLGRIGPHRAALFKNQIVSLIRYGRICTTLPKAKEMRHFADRMVTLGKRGTLAARRQARRFINDRDCLAKLFTELAPRFKDRQGGYTRLLKMGFRSGDQAPLALLEYVDNPIIPMKPVTKKNKEAKVKKLK